MLGALIIVFREVIEAGIIVGIVMAVTRGLKGARFWIAGGIAGGVAGAALVAAFAETIAAAPAGAGQGLFKRSIPAPALLMLARHNIFVSSPGPELAAQK